MDSKTKSSLNQFFQSYRQVKYQKNQLILEADQNPSGAIYLQDGVVRQYGISPSGEDFTINIYKPPSFFPMGWIINNQPNAYYYEAMTNVTVSIAPKTEFLDFFKGQPMVMFDLLSRLYRGLDGFFLKMGFLLSGKARSILIVELIIMAKRFGELHDSQIVVKLNLNEQTLASQAGIARETVSRELKKLVEEGLISYKNRQLIIYDLKALENQL